MEVHELLDELTREGALLTAAVERGDPDAKVPSCPDWTLRDLVQHAGGIHRWATRIVVERSEGMITDSLESIAGGWPDDRDLAAWFRAGHTLLVDALTAAPDDMACFAFLPAPSPRAFWARRQAHETTIHRVDAELATFGVSEIPAPLATDGIDELLTGFLPRRGSKLKPETTVRYAICPTDVDASWVVTAGPEGATTERGGTEGEVVLRGSAADLYLLLWNRGDLDGIEVTGDPSLLDLWRTTVQVRWG